MKRLLAVLLCFAFLLCGTVVSAEIIPVDLNDFWADPTVTVTPDGSSATMAEDPDFGTVLLSNDPYFGDPGIAVPSGLLSLNFDYSFTEGTNNDDDFYAWVFDGDTGDFLDDFLIEDSGSGSISWDLSAIDPGITLLGLEFQLNAWDDLYDSFAEISNVYLETSSTPVPEPATMFLLGSGLFGLVGVGRKKFLNKS